MQKHADFRHEYKLQLNQADCLALRARLKAVVHPDAHAGADGKYRIRSLYFDNIYDKALMEKLDGVDCRDKYRIRYYGQDTEQLSLEKKSKRAGLCNKQTFLMTRAQCEDALMDNYEWAKLAASGVANGFYIDQRRFQLRPKVIVEYAREAYVYPAGNVRITLDSDIRSGLNVLSFLDPAAALLPAAPGIVILEIKYDEYLPDAIRDILQLNCRNVGAFSKYAACRIYG